MAKRQDKLKMIEYDPRWNLDKGSLDLLSRIIKRYKPKKILEIGTYNGYTTEKISGIIDKDAEIITIEKDQLMFKKSEQNLKDKKNTKVINGDAKEVLKDINTKFDLIFIDAVKREYIEYIKIIEQNNLLKKNAIIIADNVISHKEKVKEYLYHVKNRYDSETIDIGKGLEITKV